MVGYATAALAALGAWVLGTLAAIGRVALFGASALGHSVRAPFYPREIGLALLNIGWLSLPVVGLTALFTGGALALQ
ncbi:MAG: ABC transporter permease, partial [Paracoccaceae bacterium]